MFTKSSLLGPRCVLFAPYSSCNSAVIYMQVLSQESGKVVPLEQNEVLFKSGPRLLGPKRVHVRARDRRSEVDREACFLSYLMQESLSDIISNKSLNSLRDDSPELDIQFLQRGLLTLVFETLSRSFITSFKLGLPQSSRRVLTGLNGNENNMMRPDSQPAVNSFIEIVCNYFQQPNEKRQNCV